MFSSAFANDLAKLIFQATAIAGLADNAASGALTSLYLSLHTADPLAAGTQTTSEVNYSGYTRIALQRGPLGWTVTGNVVNPTGTAEFPEMTGGANQTATHLCVGTAASGSGKVLVRMTISPSIECKLGVVPRIRQTSTLTLVTS
ncbi:MULTISPECIES: hypothetical protein [unclassified Comamonas]|jgi:hypothetical protein|uniref:phage tail fiber protein n=1 Tax=unclassified Comamonas TaxID=2638500 RepID=UPI00289F33D4|nr:hypothetical protein [Comamonas sp.]